MTRDALELLTLEAETIWGGDATGLGDGTVHVTVATYDGRSATLPGATPMHPDTRVTFSHARSWLLSPGTYDVPAGLRLVDERADDGPRVALWRDDQVVSVAHCARLTDRAAEVGVETDEAERGRGLAAVVVAAWSERMHDSGRVLFYSALEDNPSSHRVAERCHAEPLGRLTRVYVESGG